MPVKLEHDHSPEAIRERLSSAPRGSYLRDWIYGGIDGAVTTFAIVAGVAGAEMAAAVVLVLGLANLIADGFSMAAGNYLAVKAEAEEFQRLLAVERRHIAIEPEGEREEVRQIFAAKGFNGEDLERVVAVVTADETVWTRTMATEEYGVTQVERSPLRAGATTFAAFILCGVVPLLTYIVGGWVVCVAATALTFFVIGAVKSRWSTVDWRMSGLETLLIGMAAASLAYVVGYGLRGLL